MWGILNMAPLTQCILEGKEQPNIILIHGRVADTLFKRLYLVYLYYRPINVLSVSNLSGKGDSILRVRDRIGIYSQISIYSKRINHDPLTARKEFRMRQPLFMGNHYRQRPFLTLFIIFQK